LSGITWFDILWLYLDSPSFSGWYAGMLYRLKIGCVVGGLMAQWTACFAMLDRNLEIIDLFFGCSFRRIWHALMSDCFIQDPPVEWDDIVRWFSDDMRGKSFKANLCRLCLGATIYHLWRQINDLFHGNIPRCEEAIIVQIRWEVRSRLLVKCPTKKLAKNLDLVHRWNLQPSLHL
jgi:hypothetical protein